MILAFPVLLRGCLMENSFHHIIYLLKNINTLKWLLCEEKPFRMSFAQLTIVRAQDLSKGKHLTVRQHRPIKEMVQLDTSKLMNGHVAQIKLWISTSNRKIPPVLCGLKSKAAFYVEIRELVEDSKVMRNFWYLRVGILLQWKNLFSQSGAVDS